MESNTDQTKTGEANNDVAITENENSTEKDGMMPGLQIPEALNVYRNKKTLTQGLMDLALFSANANQLRYVFERGASTGTVFIYIIASLIIISLVLQVGVGVLLLLSTRYTICQEKDRKKVYQFGNYVTVGIFLVTVVNVFIAAFGGSAMAGVTVV